MNRASEIATRRLVQVDPRTGEIMGPGLAWEIQAVKHTVHGLALYGFNHYTAEAFVWYFTMQHGGNREYDWSRAVVQDAAANRTLARVFPTCPLVAGAPAL